MAKLSFEGGGEPRDLHESDVCRIGRDPGNEVTLDDSGSSRRHCRISHDGRDWVLEDLQSANGTFLNDERVDRVKLADGDQIKIGASVMTFSVAGAAASEGGEIVLEGGESSEPAGAPAKAAKAAKAKAPENAPFEIAFTRGERAGERVPVAGERVTFGRKTSNTISLKDAKISGVHCEVGVEDGRPVLRDLGSTNGTFLEGKRIDEIVLDHGDRVVVGDSEFVLVDAGQPPVDLSAGQSPDVGQTMINIPKPDIVRDTTQAPNKKKGGVAAVLGLVVLIAALVGAGWFYLDVRKKSAPPEAPAPATGNLLADGWSFELTEDGADPREVWAFSSSDDASFDIASTGARSGQQALRASPSGGIAEARLKAGVKTSGRNYRVSGFVKASGDGVGTVSAVFLRDDDPTYEVAVPIGSSSESGWTEVTGDAVAPSGASHLVVALSAAGSDDVLFDDFGVFDTGVARPGVTTVNQFEFELAGQSVLLRRGDELLRLGPLSVEAAGIAVDAGRHLHGDRMVVAAGGSVGYASALEQNNHGANWRVEWPDASGIQAVRLPLLLLPALTGDPVGVVRGTALEPYLDRIDADGVDGLVLGQGATRLRIAFSAPVKVEGSRNGDVLALTLAPAVAAGRVTLDVQVDFVSEKTEAAELASKARAAQSGERLGEALAMLARITNEFPFDEAITSDAERRRNEITRRRDTVEQSLGASMERARFLGSPAAFREAESEARAAADAFDGTDAAEMFRAREVELAAERRTIVQMAEGRAATLLLARLTTALSRGDQRIARVIADHLTSRFEGSESAEEAQRLLENAGG